MDWKDSIVLAARGVPLGMARQLEVSTEGGKMRMEGGRMEGGRMKGGNWRVEGWRVEDGGWKDGGWRMEGGG